MKKILIGIIAGIFIGIIWSLYSFSFPEGESKTINIIEAIIVGFPLITMCAIIGATSGFIANKLKHRIYVFLFSIVISIFLHLIFATWSNDFKFGLILGIINGVIIGFIVTVAGNKKEISRS